MMVKPEGAFVVVRQVGNDVSFADFYQTILNLAGLDPFHGLLYMKDFAKQDGAYNPVKIRSGYNSH